VSRCEWLPATNHPPAQERQGNSPSGDPNGLVEEGALLAGISAVAAVAGRTQKHLPTVRDVAALGRPVAAPRTVAVARREFCTASTSSFPETS
jgi:hypothetical protein